MRVSNNDSNKFTDIRFELTDSLSIIVQFTRKEGRKILKEDFFGVLSIILSINTLSITLIATIDYRNSSFY